MFYMRQGKPVATLEQEVSHPAAHDLCGSISGAVASSRGWFCMAQPIVGKFNGPPGHQSSRTGCGGQGLVLAWLRCPLLSTL